MSYILTFDGLLTSEELRYESKRLKNEIQEIDKEIKTLDETLLQLTTNFTKPRKPGSPKKPVSRIKINQNYSPGSYESLFFIN